MVLNSARSGAGGRDMRTWIEHAVFWQVYPLGFVGADFRPEAPVIVALNLEGDGDQPAPSSRACWRGTGL